jgi:hypothetical protein
VCMCVARDGTLHMLGKCSTIELHLQTHFSHFCYGPCLLFPSVSFPWHLRSISLSMTEYGTWRIRHCDNEIEKLFTSFWPCPTPTIISPVGRKGVHLPRNALCPSSLQPSFLHPELVTELHRSHDVRSKFNPCLKLTGHILLWLRSCLLDKDG